MKPNDESAQLTLRDDDGTRTAAFGHADGGDGRLVRPRHQLPRLGRRASRAPPPSAQNDNSLLTLRVRATMLCDKPAWPTPRGDGHMCTAACEHAGDADGRLVRPRRQLSRLGRSAPDALPPSARYSTPRTQGSATLLSPRPLCYGGGTVVARSQLPLGMPCAVTSTPHAMARVFHAPTSAHHMRASAG